MTTNVERLASAVVVLLRASGHTDECIDHNESGRAGTRGWACICDKNARHGLADMIEAEWFSITRSQDEPGDTDCVWDG